MTNLDAIRGPLPGKDLDPTSLVFSDQLSTDGEPVGQATQALYPAEELKLQFTHLVSIEVVTNSRDSNGPISRTKIYRQTGFLISDHIVMTAAHFLRNAIDDGVSTVWIRVPTENPRDKPNPIRVLAYQIDEHYEGENDDVALMYFSEALPSRAEPQAPLVNYKPSITCDTGEVCPTEPVNIMSSAAQFEYEYTHPKTRFSAQAVAYKYEEVEDDADWLYLFPPITERGDSGAPVMAGSQIIGLVWGLKHIPLKFKGQTHDQHTGVRVQMLQGDRMDSLVKKFKDNGKSYKDENAFYVDSDKRFVRLPNRYGYESYDYGKLETALNNVVFFEQVQACP